MWVCVVVQTPFEMPFPSTLMLIPVNISADDFMGVVQSKATNSTSVKIPNRQGTPDPVSKLRKHTHTHTHTLFPSLLGRQTSETTTHTTAFLLSCSPPSYGASQVATVAGFLHGRVVARDKSSLIYGQFPSGDDVCVLVKVNPSPPPSPNAHAHTAGLRLLTPSLTLTTPALVL